MTTRKEKGEEKYNIDLPYLQLSVQWNTILLPFEQSKFMSLLPDEGYIVDEQANVPQTFGTYPEVSGLIARKGTASLTMETRKPTLGIKAEDGKSLVEEFDTIEEVLRNRLSFDSTAHASFYEVLVNALVWTNQDALAVLRVLGTAGSIASRFSEKMGIGPAVYGGLRLIPVTGEINSPDWWDIRIDPSSRSPHECYRVQIVYRNSERSKVTELTSGMEQFVHTLIELLEESNDERHNSTRSS